jgi:phosphoglycerate dehydrogenase-like enzyme
VGRAVEEGGGELVPPEEAEALVWFAATDPWALPAVLDRAPGARWVQLPWAGVEPYAHLLRDGRTWTCGKGVYAEPVAEHALGLAIAGLRGLPDRVRATSWGRLGGRTLVEGRVTVLGGGGITAALLRLLAPLRCTTTVVRRSGAPLDGADRVVTPTTCTRRWPASTWSWSPWPSPPRRGAWSTPLPSPPWSPTRGW